MSPQSPTPSPQSPIPDPRSRILMLAPTPYFADRGCHVRIYEEARALIAQGCDVRIVTYHIGRDMPGIPTERMMNVPWYRRLTAGPSWQKPFLDMLLLFKALSVARRFKPQLLHAHLHEGAFIGMFLKLFLRIPLVMDFQGSLTVECRDHGFFKPDSLLDRCFALVERIINRCADSVITSSTAGAASMVKDWQLPVSKVHSVIDGVDTEQFHPYPKHQGRKKFGIPDDAPLVVFLGLLNRYQGIDLLLESIAILKGKGSRIRFLLMGYPDEWYRNKALHLGVAEMITFSGRIDYADAAICLTAGDLAVSPKLSLTEANGKLFNYMACGLPTVVFDTPVNREILGDDAVYVQYGSAEELAQAMEGLLADTTRLAELSCRSRGKAVQEHSWNARAEEIMAIYRQLLGLSAGKC